MSQEDRFEDAPARGFPDGDPDGKEWERIMKLHMLSLGVGIRIDQANYYRGEPLISDYEFDKKFQELIRLEEKFPQFKREDSPTGIVGY